MQPAKNKSMQTNFKGNNHRQPRPPSIPRSHCSAKSLRGQPTCKNHTRLNTGRRILFTSYSSPNVGRKSDLKPSHSIHLDDRRKNGASVGGSRRQTSTAKELPQVVRKKTPLIAKEVLIQNNKKKTFGENLEMIDETIIELHGQCTQHISQNHVEEKRRNQTSSSKGHAVFFIDHDEGGHLYSSPKLLPVLEEPEEETHDKSPWQYHGNGSSISREMTNPFDSIEEPGVAAFKSSWHYHGNEPRYQVVDVLFESDDDGLVIKKQGLVENRLDPVKKAMINSWILDVVLNTSTSNK